VKKHQYIAADVEWFRVVEGKLGQSVIYVEYLFVVVEALGKLAADAVSITLVNVDTEETEIDKTTEEDDDTGVDTDEEIDREVGKRVGKNSRVEIGGKIERVIGVRTESMKVEVA